MRIETEKAIGPLPASMEGLKELANRSFVPTTRRQAVAQWVATALDRRAWAIANGLPPSDLVRRIALRAMRHANRIKRADDWDAESKAFADRQ